MADAPFRRHWREGVCMNPVTEQTATAEHRLAAWLRLRPLLLVGLLLWPGWLPAYSINYRPFEEAKFQVLGEYLAARFPGARVLFITTSASRFDSGNTADAFVRGLTGGTVTVVTIQCSSDTGPMREWLLSLQDYDQVLAAHPGHDIVVFASGLPQDFEKSSFWQIPPERRPRLALGRASLAEAAVRRGLRNHDIAVAALWLSREAPVFGRAPMDDAHDLVRGRYLLVDAENLDQVRLAFPEEFQLKTPPDLALRRFFCPPPTFRRPATRAGIWCGVWLAILGAVLWCGCGRGHRRLAFSILWPSLLAATALVLLIPFDWWLSELCNEYVLEYPVTIGATTLSLASAAPDCLSGLLGHPLRSLVSAGAALVVVSAWLAWRGPRWLSRLQRTCLMMTAFAAGITLLLAYPQCAFGHFHTWGLPLPILRGGDVFYVEFLALNLACFVLPMLALGLACAGSPQRREALLPAPTRWF